MHKIGVKFVILLAVIELLQRTQQACTKSCNDNGLCYIENEIEKCECLDRIYVGEFCDQLVNYCHENPCENGGKCNLEPGYYNCLCAENFYGQNCTSKEKLFGEVYLQYNHIAPLSNDNHYLIILTDLGTVESKVEMVTPEYAIAGDLSFPSNSDFLQTNDIGAIARQFNVSLSPSISTGTVFYYAGKYRMPGHGITKVTFTITDTSFANVYAWDFQFGSLKNDGCNPVIEIRSCGTPREPVSMNVKQTFFVEANIQRDCGRDSHISYKWSISNYFDTKTLQLINAGNRLLRIPPFGMPINSNSDDVFSEFYLIKLVALERTTDGTRSGEAVNRCYIILIMDRPIAKISGGESQEYSAEQEILMDGSDSVDMAMHPRKVPNLGYSWQCSSSNDANGYCKNLNETGMFATTPLSNLF